MAVVVGAAATSAEVAIVGVVFETEFAFWFEPWEVRTQRGQQFEFCANCVMVLSSPCSNAN